MTKSSRNQPSKQTNNWQNVGLQGGTVVLHSKLELLWRLNGEKTSLLLPRLSPVNSSLFSLENRRATQPFCSLCTMGRAHAVYRRVVLYLFMFVVLCCTTYKLSKMPSKTIGLVLESFFVGGSRPVAINSITSRAGKPKSAIVSVPFGLEVHLSLKIFKLLLAAQLVVLSGDVMLNPGPLHGEFVCPSE